MTPDERPIRQTAGEKKPREARLFQQATRST
jgi:hypothetical protein